jgi:NAD(P)H dehydrogenase (quinone)
MAKLLISYSTGTGTTETFARAVAEGAAGVEGVEVTLRRAADTVPEDVAGADGIILGAPVHMGTIDWQMKKLIDGVFGLMWIQDALVGRVGATFVSGSGIGNAGSGAELALLALLANMAELGMVIVSLPKNTPGYATNGMHWGAVAITGEGADHRPLGVPDAQLTVARHHGMNVARVTAALAGKRLLNP